MLNTRNLLQAKQNIPTRSILLLCGIIFGLATSRILFEFLFPRFTWIGRPFLTFLLALFTASTVLGMSRNMGCQASLWYRTIPFIPLLLNLIYLIVPTVELVRSRLIYTASIWLTTLLLVYLQGSKEKWSRVGLLLVIAALLPVYLLTMSHSVGRADTFEVQVVAPQLGIAHPTGYPLYLILGKLFTLIPAGSVAWRLNLGSVVFALSAVSFIYLTIYVLLTRRLPAVLGAVVFGFTATFWSQAIEAEVYALHALIVSLSLWLMAKLDNLLLNENKVKLALILFFVIGLGLTNHLTTLFLLPPALLSLFFAFRIKDRILNLKTVGKLVIALVLPLFLYAYLPIRWLAVNGEPMGFNRFLEWVIGGRFQGALQWSAWLIDPTRYEIIGRIFLENWGWFNLFVSLIGFSFLLFRNRRITLVLFVTWFGYAFYALNYYVPDLAVFLIPSQLIVAIFWSAGFAAIADFGRKNGTIKKRLPTYANLSRTVFLTLLPLILIPTLFISIAQWPEIDRSRDDGLIQWGKGVLELPLDPHGAILADSEKIAPLYYLQQAEGIQTELEIMVLPDETAYRNELDSRLSNGQSVYLARFLPGLEGIYHLRSLGPLTEVSLNPLTTLPGTATPTHLDFNSVQMIGYEIEPIATIDNHQTAVTLFWQADSPINELLNVYVRWATNGLARELDGPAGQHPANNYYPTIAWQPGEIVPDFHLLPRMVNNVGQELELQVGLAPPYTTPDEIPWQTVTTMASPAIQDLNLSRPLRLLFSDVQLDGVDFPSQIRPKSNLPITLKGFGHHPGSLKFSLRPIGQEQIETKKLNIVDLPANLSNPFVYSTEISTDLPNGRYHLIVEDKNTSAICGWMAAVSESCVIGRVEINGIPLPDGATNFEDKIALLSFDIPETNLQPGGLLHLNLNWQSLASMNENYTVFVQVLDVNDQIVGQVDSWPVQGTHPTSQWRTGETINDPYAVQLDSDLSPGSYKLYVGWYLLGTLRRLPVLNDTGVPIKDKVVIPGLVIP